jgi:hypothetical protein
VGAAREHGIIDALNGAEVATIADSAYRGGGSVNRVPQRNGASIPIPAATAACHHPETGEHRPRPLARPS